MAIPFLQCGNLYFVPVLQNRLSLAALVHRAFRELSREVPWSSEDLIAVNLPGSIREKLEEGIRRLPQVSLLTIKVGGEGSREVFAVTPSDGRIEAVRTGLTNKWPIEYTDLEISPGNLLRGPCLRDPNWPDDSLIHHFGVERYLDMIEPYFAVPPARLEPLDTWRQNAIAHRLRELHPLYRRVLVVCDAPLIRPVITLLQQESSAFTVDTGHKKREFSYELVQQLRPEVLLTYLDDYPKLVERFEESRDLTLRPDDEYGWKSYDYSYDSYESYDRGGNGQREREGAEMPFDKRPELMRMVQESVLDAHDLHFSTRQHKAFNTFIRNLSQSGKRISPSPDMLYQAARCCYGIALAERLLCHLSSYKEQIKVENIRPKSNHEEGYQRYRLDIDSQLGGYVSRTCTPNTIYYDYVRPPRRKHTESDDNEYIRHNFMPEVMFLEAVHKKLGHLVTSTERKQMSNRYRGSIEMGIDVRRTLRTTFRGLPELYVKRYVEKRVQLPSENEPVLWILTENLDEPGRFSTHPIGRRVKNYPDRGRLLGENFWIGSQEIFGRYHTLPSHDHSIGNLFFFERLGWLTFGFHFQNDDQARAEYGESFTMRVLNHADFDHPPIGCVHRDFADLAREGATWYELSLLTALKCAEATVVVVAPTSFKVPALVMNHPVSKGKTLRFVPLSRFSHSERNKLTSHYQFLTHSSKSSRAEAALEILMRRYWE